MRQRVAVASRTGDVAVARETGARLCTASVHCTTKVNVTETAGFQHDIH